MQNTKVKMINVIYIVFAIFAYFVYLIMYATTKDLSDNSIYFVSLFGLVTYLLIMFNWYKNTGKIFDLYTIFMTLLFLFNFGQCIMWAFNIHIPTEIKGGYIIGNSIVSSKSIFLAQIIVIVSSIFFHCGVLFYLKFLGTNRNKNNQKKLDKKSQEGKVIQNEKKDNDVIRKSVYYTSIVLSFIVIPITFFYLFSDLQIANRYGYGSLYYGENANNYSVLYLFSRLFFPTLFGLLIGSNFKKNIRFIVYIFFALFTILSIMIGDRGGWFYSLLILLYLHHTHVKKINIKQMIMLIIIGYFSLALINTIVSVRNFGMNYDLIFKNFTIQNNPIINSVFEMGGTMFILTSIIENGIHIYPYGNSFIFAIFGIVSDKIFSLLNINYIDLNTWFSQYFLGLKGWGVGFSMIGEVVMNFGVYFSPIIMFLLGILISRFIVYDKDTSASYRMFNLISFISFCSIIRGAASYYLKGWFFCIVIFFSINYLIENFIKRKI